MDKQNFFSFFNLKPSLVLDENELRNLYMKNVKAFHPDFYISDPELYQENLKKSSLNNNAYKVLNDFMSRVAYYLECKGLYHPEQKTQLPPDFLMEVMELNEQLDEVLDSQDPQEQAKFVAGIQKNIDKTKEALLHVGSLLNENETEALLNQAFELFQKLKYFQNLLVRSNT